MCLDFVWSSTPREHRIVFLCELYRRCNHVHMKRCYVRETTRVGGERLEDVVAFADEHFDRHLWLHDVYHQDEYSDGKSACRALVWKNEFVPKEEAIDGLYSGVYQLVMYSVSLEIGCKVHQYGLITSEAVFDTMKSIAETRIINKRKYFVNLS